VILDPAEPVFAQANLDHERAKTIEDTLAAFGAPAHVVEVHKGPTVTQFGVEPDFVEARGQKMRVRVSKIVALTDDIALALAAPRIRIQAPVPGRNYVGIEVPNTEATRVTLREVMESEAFQKIRSPLRFAVGKDVSGKSISYDLATMPHMLIAGTTGSGKSVCVNSILCCFLMNNSPADLRLVLVDPKRVELTGYNGIPHLLAPVITDAERVVGALQWMLREMDSRYRKFSRAGVRNIQEYNEKQSAEHLAFLLIVIDELADLMMLAPEETERSITRLAQLARATGIHMILATQRPSVDVVTGLIKANFPARIAFAVSSQIDSRVILDQPGAERLLGRGDMLFQAPDASAPARLQGVWVSDSEIQRLVDYWRLAAASVPSAPLEPGAPVDALPAGVPLRQNPLWDLNAAESSDPLTSEAIDLVRKEGRASITMLQRRMRIGYTRAARLIDALEQKAIIGPSQPNSQVREILDYGPVGPPKDE
jgi:S-DNA-T family DNA segregation ATPase FtsK/SpoIIIE